MGLTLFTYEYYEKLLSYKGNLIRHDIDLSLIPAKKMADIDYKNGIRSYFFIQLRSNFYNPNSKENYKILKHINDLGHYIGLHFDIKFYNIKDDKKLNDALLNESKMIPFCRNFFSYHINTEETKKFSKDYSLINIYNRNKNYISDSNHKPNDLLNFLNNNEDVQINIHPEWWTKEYKTQLYKVKKIIRQKNKLLKNESNRLYL